MHTAGDNPEQRSQNSARCGVAGAIFAAVFVATAWFPPGPAWGEPEASGTFARMYPGVPAPWVALRSVCLGLASLCLALWVRGGRAPTSCERIGPDLETPAPHSRAFASAALVAAGLQLLSVPFVEGLGPVLQLAYIGWLFVPALLIAAGARHRTALAWRPGAGAAAILAVIAGWMYLRFPAAQADPRSASLVDCWLCWQTLESASAAEFNVLTDGPLPGLTSLHLAFDGAGIFGRLTAPGSFRAVALLHLSWIAVGAAAIAAATRRRFGTDAAVVAVAAFLFSPYLLAGPLNPCSIHFGAAAAGTMLWLYVRAADDGAPWATAALGATAGIAATHPAVAPVAGLLCVAALVAQLRGTHKTGTALFAGGCSFLAAAVPAVPGPAELQGMLERYVGWSQGWVGIERVLLGQSSVFSVPSYWGVEVPSWEIATGALLGPFVTPRTPLRLWGDALLEPASAVLALLGLALATIALFSRGGDRRAHAGLSLLLFGAAVLPAFASSFDRPSLVRMLCLPAAAAWATAAGYAAILARSGAPANGRLDHGARRESFERPVATVFAALAIAASGTWVFDFVNPSILPASATSIALELASPGQDPAFTLLEHDGSSEGEDQKRLDWMFVETSADALAPGRLRTRPIGNGNEHGWDGDGVLLWSPSLQADLGLRDRLCRERDDVTAFSVRDRSGISEILAAAAARSAWTPPLPEKRWTAVPCHPPSRGRSSSPGADHLDQARPGR
jgi:hypothetical protein